MKEWDKAAPSPAKYPYRRSIKSHPFMGRDKFPAGHLHHRRSGRSYLRAYPSWDNDAPTPCPSGAEAADIFAHASLDCSSKDPARIRHFQGIPDIGPDAPIWS